MKKVCVVTGSRADYGLLRWVIQGISESNKLDLQLVVTGMHLSPEFGLTWRDIETDGFHIDKKVETLLSSDTPVGIAKAMGLGMVGFADAYLELQPDVVLVLGDRYEIFAAVASAMVARIPIAHLHGGEATEGLIDEAIRHSITKMSQIHFVATETYRSRVLQLGEPAERVFNVGGLGVDGIFRQKLLTRAELEGELDFQFGERSLLVTFHPVTLEADTAGMQMSELLNALAKLEDTNILFTLPNADTNGRILIEMIANFVQNHPNSAAFASLGQLKYLSCLHFVDGVVGNSSSGILEAPTFKIGTINIGNRQHGRIKASSVIDCKPEQDAILGAIRYLYSASFQENLVSVANPYGSGGSSSQIVSIIESLPLSGLIIKNFVDFGPA
jgi:GDP/UDP-N,N'-diacetylbacillosamine 2-epimerase (hydrolysing)